MEVKKPLPVKKKQWKPKKRPSWSAIFWGAVLVFGIFYMNMIHYNLITGGPPQPPYGSNIDIEIRVTPYWHGAPLGFTVTVLSDNTTQLDWTNNGDATGTVIRVGFGSYPAAYTDGYPVYVGNLTTYTDTGNNLDYTGEAYYSAFQQYGAGYSIDYATGLAQGEGMLAIASNISTIGILIGEWIFVLILFGFALWRYDPWLYLITAIGVGYMGITWYGTYPIIGVVVILLGAFCVYKTIRYFTG